MGADHGAQIRDRFGCRILIATSKNGYLGQQTSIIILPNNDGKLTAAEFDDGTYRVNRNYGNKLVDMLRI